MQHKFQGHTNEYNKPPVSDVLWGLLALRKALAAALKTENPRSCSSPPLFTHKRTPDKLQGRHLDDGDGADYSSWLSW